MKYYIDLSSLIITSILTYNILKIRCNKKKISYFTEKSASEMIKHESDKMER